MAETRKILIAEDDKPMAKALKLKLTKAGFEVVNAFSGQEAIDLLKSEKFNIVITDLVMPKIDGFGVLEEIQKMDLKIPVIVTSNLSQPEDEAKAKSLGAKDYFIKSNTPLVEIIDYVERALN